MIDNIPRSVIQYIYSLLYRGSTIFTVCFIDNNKIILL